jgi:hypothetical protein
MPEFFVVLIHDSHHTDLIKIVITTFTRVYPSDLKRNVEREQRGALFGFKQV